MHGPIWPLLPAETRHMRAFRCDKESPTPPITYNDQVGLIAQQGATESFCGYCHTITHDGRYTPNLAEKLSQGPSPGQHSAGNMCKERRGRRTDPLLRR